MNKCVHTHSPTGASLLNAHSFLTHDNADLDFRTLLTTQYQLSISLPNPGSHFQSLLYLTFLWPLTDLRAFSFLPPGCFGKVLNGALESLSVKANNNNYFRGYCWKDCMTIYRNKTKTLGLDIPISFVFIFSCCSFFLLFFCLLVLWSLVHPWVVSATFMAIIISSSHSPKHISSPDFSLEARPLKINSVSQGHPNLSSNWTHCSLSKIAPLIFSILTPFP